MKKLSAPNRTVPRGNRDSMLPVKNDVQELRMLFELSQILDGSDIAHMLDGALALMARYMNMMRGVITLISPHNGEIRIETAYGLKESEKQRGRYALGEGVTGRVIQTGKAMVISNVSKSPLFLNRTRSRNLSRESIAFICVPIKLEDQVVGALSVDRLFSGENFKKTPFFTEADFSSKPQGSVEETLEEDERLLSIIASMLARAARVRQNSMDSMESATAVIAENMRLRNTLAVSSRPTNFVGNSEKIQEVYEQIAQVAQSTTTVFLQGESGTGKELAAQAIHAASGRGQKPFVSLNCAALPENLIESELFGHEKGAFTGASGVRKGRFEMADGGTLFLDEVGEMSLITQAKLLRVLQERCFERLGGMKSIHVDVRIITATNRSLQRMVEEGTFRRDLYYRLNVFPIHMPPLRERQNDILPLAGHFAETYASANGRFQEKMTIRLSLTVMDMLQRYSWPGNIRELENVMERAVLLVGSDGLILPQHLPPDLHSAQCVCCGAAQEPAPSALVISHGGNASLQSRIEELERSCIAEALKSFSGHMGHAAQSLGLTERIMALRMKKYGISYKDYRTAQ